MCARAIGGNAPSESRSTSRSLPTSRTLSAVTPDAPLARNARALLSSPAGAPLSHSTTSAGGGRAAHQAGCVPRSSSSARNLGTVRALVSAGLGVAVVPAAARALKGARIHGVQLSRPNLVRVVALARNTVRHGSPAARTFAGFLNEQLR